MLNWELITSKSKIKNFWRGDNAYKNVFRYSYFFGGGTPYKFTGGGTPPKFTKEGAHRTNSNLLGEKGKRHRTNSMSKKIYWGGGTPHRGGHHTKLKVGC